MTTTTLGEKRPPLRLRIALAIVAALELADALSSVQNIFVDYHHETRLLKVAQAITSVQLALWPVLAAAGLACAIAGRLRLAIIVLAALILATWASDLPSLLIHGLEINATLGGASAFAARFLYPLMAAAAIVLARRGARLGLATLLVSLPTIFALLGVVAFTIVVATYGF